MKGTLYGFDGVVVGKPVDLPGDVVPAVVLKGARVFTFLRDMGRHEDGHRVLEYGEAIAAKV